MLPQTKERCVSSLTYVPLLVTVSSAALTLFGECDDVDVSSVLLPPPTHTNSAFPFLLVNRIVQAE
jgi:hypothetical protein